MCAEVFKEAGGCGTKNSVSTTGRIEVTWELERISRLSRSITARVSVEASRQDWIGGKRKVRNQTMAGTLNLDRDADRRNLSAS